MKFFIENILFGVDNPDSELVIPYGVTSITGKAFSGENRITSVVIPDTVTQIGAGAFSKCENLTSVSIPASVTYMGQFVFYDCIALKKINFSGTKAQWEKIENNAGWQGGLGAYTVYCTDGEINR